MPNPRERYSVGVLGRFEDGVRVLFFCALSNNVGKEKL
ncbi:hypothetical protein WZ211_2745 [Enterococcus faecalis]|nr:hypothetical protein WZ211_2745 [Enterococcus faecalis]